MKTIEPNVVQSELENRLLRTVHSGLGIDVPAADVDLLESGLIDSLLFVELLVLVEQEFGVAVELADLDLDDFRSIRRIAGFIGGCSGNGNGGNGTG